MKIGLPFSEIDEIESSTGSSSPFLCKPHISIRRPSTFTSPVSRKRRNPRACASRMRGGMMRSARVRPDDFIAPPAESYCGIMIPIHHLAIAIHDDDGIESGVENQPPCLRRKLHSPASSWRVSNGGNASARSASSMRPASAGGGEVPLWWTKPVALGALHIPALVGVMVDRRGSGRAKQKSSGFPRDPPPASSLVDHIKTWAVAPRPVDKLAPAETAPFGANWRHAVGSPGGWTPEKSRLAGRSRARPCWWPPIRAAGLPVTVPALGRSPSWRTMPPMGEGLGRYCSHPNNHH